MAEVTLHNELVIHTNGDLPAVGAKLPEFSVLAADLSEISSADFAGKNLVLNIFPPSIPVCAQPASAPSTSRLHTGEHRRAVRLQRPALRNLLLLRSRGH